MMRVPLALCKGETKDIIEMDVSGEKMTTKRSTLMLCAESALARKFDEKVWAQDEGGIGSDSDDEGVPIDHSAYSFGKILDQLRLRAINQPGAPLPPAPTVAEHQRKNFERVVWLAPGSPANLTIRFAMIVRMSDFLPLMLPAGGVLLPRRRRICEPKASDHHRTRHDDCLTGPSCPLGRVVGAALSSSPPSAALPRFGRRLDRGAVPRQV